MKRRTILVVTITVMLCLAPLTSNAQEPSGKGWRLGWLSPASALTGASELEALRAGLRELNDVEGRNLTIEARWADDDPARLPELARALVALKVDVICTAGTPATLAAKRARAKALNVVVDPLGVHDRPSLETAFAAIRRGRPDALMTTADALIASYRMLIVDFAPEHRLVSMFGDRSYVKVGGLMFYGTSLTDMWHHGAIYVDRIFRGAKPGQLPVEQPTKFELVINLKTAKSLGLTIPPSVLLRVDEVIQ